MITHALRAEVRKLKCSKLWWLLLLPALLGSYLISVLGALIATLPDKETLRQIGGRFPSLLGVSVAYSAAFTSLLTVSLGITIIAGEARNRAFTNTLLTIPNRSVVLGAKAVVALGVGLLYALALPVGVVLGGLSVGGWSVFPPGYQLLAAVVTGGAVVIGWTMLGLGIGTLVRNPFYAVPGTLLVRLVVENFAGFVLRRVGAGSVADVLPSAASLATTRRLAVDFVIERAPLRSQADFEDLLAGSSLNWWTAGLVFGVWVLAFAVGAWWTLERKDVR